MANGQTFIDDMMRFASGSQAKLDALARQSTLELAIRIQDNTGPPIGPNIITGFLIGSWQPSIGAPPPMPNGEAELSQKDTAAELDVVLSSLRIGETFYYVNNAAYAMRRNYGFTGTDSLGRHYAEPGKFFLEKTVAQWPDIVAEMAADLQFTP